MGLAWKRYSILFKFLCRSWFSFNLDLGPWIQEVVKFLERWSNEKLWHVQIHSSGFFASLWVPWKRSWFVGRLVLFFLNYLIHFNEYIGETYEESIFHKIPLFRGGYNQIKSFCSFFMRRRENLLEFADIAAELVPICFQGLYRVHKISTIFYFVF